MNDNTSMLDRITVASPCSADWNAMQGDDKKRFCGQCKLHVFQLSAMTRGEAEDLLRNATGRVCARFHRRADGTVLTRDCPVGWKKRVRWAWARAVALASALLVTVGCARRGDEGVTSGGTGITGTPGGHTDPEALMGDVALPPLMGEAVVEPPLSALQDPEPVEIMGRIAIQPEQVAQPLGKPK